MPGLPSGTVRPPAGKAAEPLPGSCAGTPSSVGKIRPRPAHFKFSNLTAARWIGQSRVAFDA
jgi:hypothetical protein